MNRLLPMATINTHMKFEIEIPKQTWLMLRKPCRLQTDGQTDRRTYGQGESSIPPSNFVGRGYNNNCIWLKHSFQLSNAQNCFTCNCYSLNGVRITGRDPSWVWPCRCAKVVSALDCLTCTHLLWWIRLFCFCVYNPGCRIIKLPCIDNLGTYDNVIKILYQYIAWYFIKSRNYLNMLHGKERL